MSNVFITADEHYGHKSIIKFCDRPFGNREHLMGCTLHRCVICQQAIDDQTETIIERHNAKVPNKPSYLTIHVGDLFWHTLTFDEAMTILKRLNGRHAFIYGNHDELVEKYQSIFAPHFDWIKGQNKDSGTHRLHFNGNELTLCHYAMRVWNRSHKGSWMCFGHSHDELPVVGKSFDIGVDGNNFTPWSLEEIEAKMNTLPLGHIITKVWPGKEAPKAGSTVHHHPAGETCGFCKMGGTR